MVSSPFCSLLSICDYQLGTCTVSPVGLIIAGLQVELAFVPPLTYICYLAAGALTAVNHEGNAYKKSVSRSTLPIRGHCRPRTAISDRRWGFAAYQCAVDATAAPVRSKKIPA